MSLTLPKQLIERAFELARSPECATSKAIQIKLKREGYSQREISQHFMGKALRTQLKKLLAING